MCAGAEMTWRVTTALLAAVIALAQPLATPAQQPPYEHQDSIAEIYDLNKHLLGTGTVVSLSGLILTAKHIFKFPDTGTYRMVVQVSFANTKEFLRAELVAAHPYLDLAVLEIRGGTRPFWPALPVMLNKGGIKQGQEVHLIGHKLAQGDKGHELSIERAAKIDNPDFSGHIEIDRPVDRGTSGGPVISDGKVAGVVVETDFLDKTLVTPLWNAVDYFTIVGVAFLGEEDAKYAKRQNTTADLLKRASAYEKIFSDILLDLEWSAEFNMNGPTINSAKGTLSVGFVRKLRAQLLMEAKLVIAVAPIFEGDAINGAGLQAAKGFSQDDWVDPPNRSVTYDDLDKEIKRLMRHRRNLTLTQLSGLDVKLRVEPENFVGLVEVDFVELPFFHVCFNLRRATQATGAPIEMKGKGKGCQDEHAYLDRYLPTLPNIATEEQMR